MSLWFRAVVGVHLSFGGETHYDDMSQLEQKFTEKLSEAGIPNSCCDYLDASDNGKTAFAIGSYMPKIDAASGGEYCLDTLPDLSDDQMQKIDKIANEMIDDLRELGITADIAKHTGFALHATS